MSKVRDQDNLRTKDNQNQNLGFVVKAYIGTPPVQHLYTTMTVHGPLK